MISTIFKITKLYFQIQNLNFLKFLMKYFKNTHSTGNN